jgi:hypothetical protein
VQNEINQALGPPAALHIELRIGDVSDSKEINRLLRLDVRDDPNLEVIPQLDNAPVGMRSVST